MMSANDEERVGYGVVGLNGAIVGSVNLKTTWWNPAGESMGTPPLAGMRRPAPSNPWLSVVHDAQLGSAFTLLRRGIYAVQAFLADMNTAATGMVAALSMGAPPDLQTGVTFPALESTNLANTQPYIFSSVSYRAAQGMFLSGVVTMRGAVDNAATIRLHAATNTGGTVAGTDINAAFSWLRIFRVGDVYG